jgi:glycosyltransferase involved in cell wall biosynthesis
VGRWQDTLQKRTWLLIDVIHRLLDKDAELIVVIVGNATDELRKWHAALPTALQGRVRLAGMMGREELATLLAESQVFYSPSAYESFGIAAGEALCAGCSVVAGQLITLPSFEWFVSEESGRLAEQDDAAGHAEALSAELDAWNGGWRDAQRISETWCGRLHADKVAGRILGMLNA